ncbi:SRPBCC domain-containing protein [Salinicoccus kekensis]|uniref:Activator of Hsp90 ATPase-like protein n=1 Tax=Salinicoccus kekensis TaxID=714307 RepID=A0A285UF98_9STAP|nr:SRPBCC domain-containing protein [Salinicoccus kekensis]SOC40614.1 activator of Hsp90 ATPase-like protein [Salinicoccus kekensis]
MSKRIDKASALVGAPQESIYQSFVKEEAFKKWMAPHDMTMEIEAFDAVEGGMFTVNLIYNDREAAGKTVDNIDRYTGVFKTLEPYNRVIFTVEFDTDDESFQEIMEQEWTMIGQGNETEVFVTCRNVPEGIDQEVHERALIVALYRLADHLGVEIR